MESNTVRKCVICKPDERRNESVPCMMQPPENKSVPIPVRRQRNGAMSLRALAREAGRDVKNVHTDIHVLKEIGLVEDHAKGGVWVPYNEIEACFSFRSAA